MRGPSVDRASGVQAPGAAEPPPAPDRGHPPQPTPGRRAVHGALVALATTLSAAGLVLVGLSLSLCGLAGGRCTPEELGAIDAANGSAGLVLVVGTATVVVAVRSAGWRVTAAVSVGLAALALAIGVGVAAGAA